MNYPHLLCMNHCLGLLFKYTQSKYLFIIFVCPSSLDNLLWHSFGKLLVLLWAEPTTVSGGLTFPLDGGHYNTEKKIHWNIHRLYRVSIKSFPDYKHLLQETLRCTSVRRVSAVDNFTTRWCTSTLGFRRSSVFGCNISKQVDSERWPPRSPDITPLEFFLWGYVTDKVFSKPVPDITNLKARITDASVTITEDILENTWREIGYRLDILRATKGAHVEVY